MQDIRRNCKATWCRQIVFIKNTSIVQKRGKIRDSHANRFVQNIATSVFWGLLSRNDVHASAVLFAGSFEKSCFFLQFFWKVRDLFSFKQIVFPSSPKARSYRFRGKATLIVNCKWFPQDSCAKIYFIIKSIVCMKSTCFECFVC